MSSNAQVALHLDSKEGEINCISEISDNVTLRDDILCEFSQAQ